MTQTPALDLTLRRAFWAVGLLCFGLGAVGFATGGSAWGWGALAGGAIALANLYTLARSVTALLGGQRGPWTIVVVLKFLVLVGLTYGLFKSGWVSPFGVALGFAALPLGVLVASAFPARPALLAQKIDHA